MIFDYPSSAKIVVVNPNIHNEWLGSQKIDQQRSQDLTNIVHGNTVFPRALSANPNPLVLYLTISQHSCTTKIDESNCQYASCIIAMVRYEMLEGKFKAKQIRVS